jgi:hypothetical protein
MVSWPGGGEGRNDNFVCLNLAVITGESNTKEVPFVPEFSKFLIRFQENYLSLQQVDVPQDSLLWLSCKFLSILPL